MSNPSPAPHAEAANVLQVFHININCSDFERSLAFYQMLGFRQLVDFEENTPTGRRTFGAKGLGPVLNLPDDCDGRACLLALGDDPRATRLDLIEWKQPRTSSPGARGMAQTGVARICLKVRDCAALYQRLLATGCVIYSPPTLIELAGSHEYVFCCEDPDGVVIEFMQFVRP